MKNYYKGLTIFALMMNSCANSIVSSPYSENNSYSSIISDVIPQLQHIYFNNGYSALVDATIEDIYDNTMNSSNEKCLLLKLKIHKDLFECTKLEYVYVPIETEYLVNGKKNDFTDEIVKIFKKETNVFIYLCNINYGNHINDYIIDIGNPDMYITNKTSLLNYEDFFILNNCCLEKNIISNFLIKNSIILEKVDYFDNYFYDGMPKNEIESIFRKII